MEYSLLPRFLQIELTYECNSSCTFCYNPHHRKQDDEAKRREILDEVNSYGIDHVQLLGGEVTVLPDLPGYLDQLDNIEWRSVVTNGRIYVPELKERVDEIYLSLHGTPEYHEEITQAKGSFEVIEETIRKYVSDGIKVHSDTCLTKDSADMIFDIAERAASLGMTTLFINIFQPAGIGAHSEEDNAPSLSQIRHAITQMIRARDELGLNVSFGTSTPFCLDERLITEGLAFQCGTGDWFASIDPNGELRICNQSRRSYGNILEQPLHEIWHESNIDQDYRNIGWVEEPCNSCVFKEECLGGCRVPDSGEPRIDRIVKRNEDDILNQEKLEDLLPVYESTTYSQPYG